MTEQPPDHTGLFASIAALCSAAGAWLLTKLGKQPRPIPKSLSAKDFQRITDHVDARQDARLDEALRPILDRLDLICSDLTEYRAEGRGMRVMLDHLSGRVTEQGIILQMVQQQLQRISASGGD